MSQGNKLTDGLERQFKVPSKIELSPLAIKAVHLGTVNRHNERYFGRKINNLMSKGNYLNKREQGLFVNWYSQVIQSEHKHLRNEIKEYFTPLISAIKEELSVIKAVEKEGRVVKFVDQRGKVVQKSSAAVIEALTKELVRAKEMVAELTLYAELSAKAFRDYNASFAEDFVPNLTLAEADQLTKLTLKYHSGNLDQYSLENMEVIRGELGMPKHRKLAKQVLNSKKRRLYKQWEELQNSKPIGPEEARSLLDKIIILEGQAKELGLSEMSVILSGCARIKQQIYANLPKTQSRRGGIFKDKHDPQESTLLPEKSL